MKSMQACVTNIYCCIISWKIEIAVLQFIYISICTIYVNLRMRIYSGSVPALEARPASWPGHRQHAPRQLLLPTGPGWGAGTQPHLQPPSLGVLLWPDQFWKIAHKGDFGST